MIKCHHCGEVFKPRKADRKVCPKCGSPYWKRPSLTQRLSAAVKAFRVGRFVEIKRVRRGAQCDNTTEIS